MIKQPTQIIIPPPPCLTVAMRCSGGNEAFSYGFGQFSPKNTLLSLSNKVTQNIFTCSTHIFSFCYVVKTSEHAGAALLSFGKTDFFNFMEDRKELIVLSACFYPILHKKQVLKKAG